MAYYFLECTGFSRNQFAGGNKVMFRDGTVEYPCDVIPYYSRADPDGEDMIVCDTRYGLYWVSCANNVIFPMQLS